MDDPDGAASLPPGAGDRLDRFAAAFERVDSSRYVLFATRPTDPSAIGAAMERADDALGRGARRDAAWEAIRSFVDWAAAAYSRRLPLTDTLLLYQAAPDRPEDRVVFAQNLEAALLGLVAWDLATDDDLVLLLGPFAEMAEAAAGA